MMNTFLKSISFVFHPLLMPMFGVILFFYSTPLSIPTPIIKAKLLVVFALTVLFPILIFYILKTTRQAKTIYLQSAKERIIPLIIHSVVVFFITINIFPSTEILELNYFFLGILISTICCLALAFVKFKSSIHMIASSGVLMFCIALSIHYHINLIFFIGFGFLLIGAIATSRLHMHAHTVRELIFGLFIGILPQLLLLKYWL